MSDCSVNQYLVQPWCPYRFPSLVHRAMWPFTVAAMTSDRSFQVVLRLPGGSCMGSHPPPDPSGSRLSGLWLTIRDGSHHLEVSSFRPYLRVMSGPWAVQLFILETIFLDVWFCDGNWFLLWEVFPVLFPRDSSSPVCSPWRVSFCCITLPLPARS